MTVFEGVPTMYGAMLNTPDRDFYDTSSLTLCASGGAALPVEVLRGFEAAFGCQVLEGYGLSETSPIASFNHADRERKPGSIGTPIDGVEMKLIDVVDGAGEIAIRGHNVMKGYWNRPDATAEAIDADGWFKTGDIGTVDADGYFFIVDRKKDLIIRGGYNVYPREIEEVLYEHPAVREAAVVGVPHAELGEEVGAAVALKAGADDDAGRAARVRQGAGRGVQVPAPPCGSSTSSPRARPARSSSARSSCPSRWRRERVTTRGPARAGRPPRPGAAPATRTRAGSGPPPAAPSVPTPASHRRSRRCRTSSGTACWRCSTACTCSASPPPRSARASSCCATSR